MRRMVTGIYHPAAILRGQWPKGPAQAAILARVVGNPQCPPLDVTKPPPGSVLLPSLDQVQKFAGELLDAEGVSIDIENAGRYLICVGMTAIRKDYTLGTTLCLRFRTQHGQRYWANWQDHCAAVQALQLILANRQLVKVFHNGVTYDIPVLEDHGFEVVGPVIDTMLMQNLAYSEMPKGLQFCANLYLGMPHWKHLVDEDSDAEGKS